MSSKEETKSHFICQQAANIYIHFASAVSFFPKYKWCFLQGTADFKFSDKNEKGRTTSCFKFYFFFAIHRQKHRVGTCIKTKEITLRCETLFFTGSFLNVFFPGEKFSCTRHWFIDYQGSQSSPADLWYHTTQ